MEGYEQELMQRNDWPDYALPAEINPYSEYLPEVKTFWEGYWNEDWEAADAIKTLTDGVQKQNWVEYLKILKQHPSQSFTLNLVKMLAKQQHNPRFTDALLKLLLHSDSGVAEAAENALKEKNTLAITEIRNQWSGLHFGIKEQLIRRVPKLKDQPRPEVWETYIIALKDPKPSVKLAALESIQQIEEIWMLNLLLSYCKYMPEPNNTAFQDAEWKAARSAVGQWLNRLHIKAEDANRCFCSNCHTRGVALQRSIWLVPVCRKCKNFEFLVPNVIEVVGRIGPKVETTLPMESIFPVKLWDRNQQVAHYADVDRIEIIGGGDIDYDWSVTATLERLKNSDEPHRAAVPIDLIKNPPLSENTLRMLNNREKSV